MIPNVFARPLLRLDAEQQQAKLILLIFFVSLIARAGVLAPGFAMDDYFVSYDDGSLGYSIFFSQGRFLHAALFALIHAIGVNPSDVYVAFGLLAILLQAVFVVSILRFVGVDEMPGAGLVGALIAVHPYGSEILTFRMALPGYCAGLFFSIVTLEAIIRNPSRWSNRLLAFAAMLAMAFTYQVFVNYFMVTIVFTWAFGELASADRRALNRQRALLLAAVLLAAMAAFVAVMALSGLGVAGVETRARMITRDMLPQRWREIKDTLRIFYAGTEPLIAMGVKVLLWTLVGYSVLAIGTSLWRGSTWGQRAIRTAALLLVAIALVPLSLGVVLVSQEWWPSYRVVSHLAVIGGLILLIGDHCAGPWEPRIARRLQAVGRGLALFAFVLVSNQIFADQHKLNAWDMMTANRLVARLEAHPEFRNIRFVHVDGGWGAYPAGLRTAGGNLNVSELAVSSGKAKLLAAASGYEIQRATGAREARGKALCATAPTWPDSGSVKVDGDLAVICLPAEAGPR